MKMSSVLRYPFTSVILISKPLPVPLLSPVVLPPPELVNHHLVTLPVPHDLRGNLGAFDRGGPGLHLLPVAGQQHVVKRHLGPRLALELGALQDRKSQRL